MDERQPTPPLYRAIWPGDRYYPDTVVNVLEEKGEDALVEYGPFLDRAWVARGRLMRLPEKVGE